MVDATADAMDPRDAPYAAGFLAGYHAALATLALAFGLPLPPDDPAVAWTSLLSPTVAPVQRRER